MSTHPPRRPPDGPPSRRGWRDRAGCLGQDPELFFPLGSTGRALDQTNRAKTICAGCLVRVQCLEYALVTNQDAGVWGGLTEDERRLLGRSRQRKQQKKS
jgi:WhiB family transcriptional regulator, redox-sensing transcriptional regulator